MFEGYLKLGENELGNWERTRGYAESGDCPIYWLEKGECNSLSDVLGDTIYERGVISGAPWFDSDVPESEGFLGAHIISVKGDADSTRERSVTEGVTNGGVAGRERRAGRQFRVRAWLTAAGRSSLDYGMGWLDRALSGSQCSRHGASCAGADLEFFAECPPERKLVPDLSPWVVTAKNLALNSMMKRAGSGTTIVRRNECNDPVVLGGGNTWNTSSSGASKTTTPGGKTAIALARSNQATVLALWYTAARKSVVPGEAIAFSSEGVVGPGMRLCTDIQWFRADGSSVSVSTRQNLLSPSFTSTPSDANTPAEDNVPRRFGRVVIAPAGAVSFTMRAYVDSGADGTAYITDFLIERVPAVLPFFFGGTVDDTGIAYSWEGAVNASPSVAKASVQEVRRNFAVSPLGVAKMIRYQATESQTVTENVPVSDHPLGITTANRVDYTVAGPGTNPGVQFTLNSPIPPGTTITIGAWVKVLTTQRAEGYALAIATQASEASRTLQVGVWTYLTWTATTTSTNRDVGFRHSTATVGDYSFLITGMQVEIGSTLGGLFDGNTTPDANLTPSWTGPAQQSPSILSGVYASQWPGSNPVGTSWLAHGGGLVITNKGGVVGAAYREVSLNYPGLPDIATMRGKTYTVLARSRVVGPVSRPGEGNARTIGLRFYGSSTNIMSLSAPVSGEVAISRVVATVPQDATSVGLRPHGLNNQDTNPSGLVIWDEILLVEGVYEGPYFDGYSIPADPSLERYAWLGTPNASMSIYETRVPIERMQTDEEYAAVVDPLRRYAHDVKVISGPFEVSTRESRDGIHVGREVEYTLYAEQGWIYGKAEPVSIPPILPVVVDDVPVNLVPYPSAELGINEVTVAVNHAPNPSLELDAVGWSGARYAGDGSATVSVAGSRVVGERAFSGSSSFRLRIAGSSTAAAGQGSISALIEAQVSLANLAAGSKVSLHIWGALVFVAGPTSLPGSTPPRMSGVYRFYNASGAPIGSAATIANAAVSEFGGRTFSLADLTIPSGAASIRVGIDVTVPTQNSTTPELNSDVRVYADAVAVTVP